MNAHANYSSTRPAQDRGFSSRNTASANEGTARCKHCSKLVLVESMEEHEAFFCTLKPIRCQHFKANGEVCGFLCSGIDALRDHYKTCKDHPHKRRSVSIREGSSARGASDRGVEWCDDCHQAFFDRASQIEHQRICPLKSVPCPLLCGVWMPRSEVPDHILYTAIKHKPLRRPSAADYGGDNIHMVVAVLMEALQRTKKTGQQQKALSEDVTSTAESSVSLNHASPRRSIASVEDLPVALIGSPKLQSIARQFAAASVELNALPVDIISVVSFQGPCEENLTKAEMPEKDGNPLVLPSSPQIEGLQDQAAAPAVNEIKAEKPTKAVAPPSSPQKSVEPRAARSRKRKTPSGAKKRKPSSAAVPAPPPVVATLRASPSAVACPPSKVRYEDFIIKVPPPAVRVKSPPPFVHLRATYPRSIVSSRAMLLQDVGELSSRSLPLPNPMAVSPRVNRTSIVL
ncbi:hypothetical protein ABL78_4152 [Leptomonas seymouri]|uniref:TRAF-type domain-containing protein n=1 Tax=Leptomonas seymouri TaxID=5684 RepID=A0A0N1PC09_LEPSE|nr:hypothetical protein ABL78_4152 [Leptomonas seymouri]|eukprot:KPI86783.1 hypothetical protein ABL78_4152 [Leptomonas seymouri]